MTFSTFLIIVQTTMLGYLEYIEDDELFLQLSFFAQILGGLGAGANSTSSMAILSSFPQSEREKYIGWVEASFGIGLLFGPMIGALLYTIGGYVMPFITFGKCTFFFIDLNYSNYLSCDIPGHHLRIQEIGEDEQGCE